MRVVILISLRCVGPIGGYACRVWDNLRKILLFNLPVNFAQGTAGMELDSRQEEQVYICVSVSKLYTLLLL